MSGNLVESLIGLVVLVVAGWFLLFVQDRTDAGMKGSYVLEARFDRVDGISVGSDVRLSGIKIGSVTGSRIDPATYQAVVFFAVRDDIELPIDTAAAISSEGLLGGAYVSLLPGGFDEMLENGDVVEETQDAVDLVGLIGKFMFEGNKPPEKE